MDKMNPGAAAAAEAEEQAAQVEAAQQADQAVVIIDDKDDQTTGKTDVLTAEALEEQEQVEDTNDEVEETQGGSGEDEPTVPEYNTPEEFVASAIATLGAGSALVEQIRKDVDLTERSKDVSDAVVEQVNQQLVVIKELLKTRYVSEANQDLYPDLHDLKVELAEIKVDALISSLPESVLAGNVEGGGYDEQIDYVATEFALTLSDDPNDQAELKAMVISRLNGTNLDGVQATLDVKTAQGENPDSIDQHLTDMEDEEQDGEKKKKIRAVKYMLKIAGFGAVALGITAKTFYDKNGLNLEAFISFILNPTGRSARAYESGSSGNGEVLALHEFRAKFVNSREAGKALVVASESLKTQNEVFNNWSTNNSAELDTLKSDPKGNVLTTHSLFVSLDKAALADGVTNVEANWDLFSDAYASAMFGGDVTLDKDSRDFLKKQLKNDGEKLKALWNIGETTTGSEPDSKTDEENVSDSTGSEATDAALENADQSTSDSDQT